MQWAVPCSAHPVLPRPGVVRGATAPPLACVERFGVRPEALATVAAGPGLLLQETDSGLHSRGPAKLAGGAQAVDCRARGGRCDVRTEWLVARDLEPAGGPRISGGVRLGALVNGQISVRMNRSLNCFWCIARATQCVQQLHFRNTCRHARKGGKQSSRVGNDTEDHPVCKTIDRQSHSLRGLICARNERKEAEARTVASDRE